MTVAIGSAAPPATAAPSADTSCQSPGTSVPVVFVHGLGGSPADFTAHSHGGTDLIQGISSIPGTFIDSFSYQAENLDWVTNPHIGQALADEITCEAAKSSAAGGVGKVLVVAHSMGGLAIREAESLTGAGTGEPASASIGLVVTIATPNTGSWADGLFHTVRGTTLVDPTDDLQLAAWLVQGACGELGVASGTDQPGEQRPGLCADVQGATSEAGSAMVPGSPQLAALPTSPSSIPLDAVAGSITATAHIWKLNFTLPVGAIGDLLVKTDSALVYGSMAGNQKYTDACVMSVSQLWDGRGWTGCTHGGLLYDPTVQKTVEGWVSGWLDTHTAVCTTTSLMAGVATYAAVTPGYAGLYQPEGQPTCHGGWATLQDEEVTSTGQPLGPDQVFAQAQHGAWKIIALIDGDLCGTVPAAGLAALGITDSGCPGSPGGSSAAPTTTTTSPTQLPILQVAGGDGATVFAGTEPGEIHFSVDNTDVVSGITWSSWTATSATGSGTWEYDSCTPDCDSATLVPYPATITLSNPQNGVFTTMVETTSGPEGSTTDFTYPGEWAMSACTTGPC